MMTSESWQKLKPILEQALTMTTGSRREFLRDACDDKAMLTEAESFLEFEDADAHDLEASALSIVTESVPAKSMVGKRVGRYEIVSELGFGGMGDVFLAIRADGEFKQEVALKLIKSGFGSESILRRFYAERQILASLEHPNIAHLIDGGTTDDDLPYFVMEYIKGESIIDFARKRQLDLAGRLDLFRQVCSGVAFAHQNLVIHRDLKPSNILVNYDGIPKLLDFGIAKLLKTENDGETLTQQLAFTPEYASPEQIRGENLTTATDTYSLGILLYELLTDVRPFKFDGKNFGQIVKAATETTPARPSMVPQKKAKDRDATESLASTPPSAIAGFISPSRLRGDIDNIVLKALNKDPQRRYSSVEKFSEDIRRHLKGLPVFARQDSWAYRAEKFTRRNPLVVGALALTFLVLLAGIIATAYQARQANAERAKAERRFNDVRTLANSFMFEINKEIKKSPIKARELLVTRALQYLDSLSGEAEGDTELQSELATSYEKIGEVQAQLFDPATGKSAEALLSQQKALQIREQLFSSEPLNISRGLGVARSRVLVGDILSMMGHLAEASDTYRDAIQLNSDLLKLEPRNAVIQRNLASNYARLGQAVLRSGSLGKALENYEYSIGIYTELISEHPDDESLQHSMGIISSYIGYVKMEMGASDEALRFFGDYLKIVAKQTIGIADNEESRSDLSTAHLWLGVALSETGDAENSLIHIRKALQIQTTIFQADRRNFGGQNSLADCYLELGRALTQKAQKINLKHSSAPVFAAAVGAYQEAIKNYDAVWQNDRQNFSVERQIAFTKLHLGRTLQLNGDRSQALSIFRQTLLALEQLTQKDPNNTEWQYDVAVCHLRIAEISKTNNDDTQAARHLQKAITMLETLSASSPENVRIKNDLAKARDGFDRT